VLREPQGIGRSRPPTQSKHSQADAVILIARDVSWKVHAACRKAVIRRTRNAVVHTMRQIALRAVDVDPVGAILA